MRYYIVDNIGNVWGDFQTLEDATAKIQTYTEQEIKENELEIIEGK